MVKSVRRTLWLSLIITLWLVTACGGSAIPETNGAGGDSIAVGDVWARPVAPMAEGEMEMPEEGELSEVEVDDGVNSAVYMTISNGSAEGDRLVSVASEVAAAVELHQTTMEDNMMQMQMVDGIEVPAGGSVSLEPGGFHIMLVDVQPELNDGDTFDLTLTFERAGEVTVQAEVRAP